MCLPMKIILNIIHQCGMRQVHTQNNIFFNFFHIFFLYSEIIQFLMCVLNVFLPLACAVVFER